MQDFLALEPEWQRLWFLQKNRMVFQHHAWVRAFIEAFCQSRQWMILVSREGGKVTALLPLYEHPATGRWRLAGSPNTDYQYLLGDEGAVVELVASLAATGTRSLLLEAMPEGPQLWQALKRKGLSLVEEPVQVRCWHLALTEEGIEAFRTRKGMLDNERRLSRLGELNMRIIGHGAEQMQLLEKMFEQHRGRWNSTARPSQFNDEATCDFYRRICRSTELAPLLHFSILEAGENLLACHLGFLHGDSFIYYKPTYDPAHKGAGKLLMCRLMQETLRMGMKEFDFTRGDDQYKMELATGMRYNHEARVFFSTGARLCHEGRLWLKRTVPRDAEGLALPTKLLRKLKALLNGR